ncbi:TPA: hypothetical protein DCY65_05420 [Candidatus Acetothermia bacterium]|nr:hypothetical protein [Candidatus Acetothermia bacterium]HAZ30985.1 hypothetical protein [Candidatus Acetothermia bacterium]
MNNDLGQEIAGRLIEIVRHVEECLGVPLSNAVVRDCIPDVAHVFLHELCHAALGETVPWASHAAEPELEPVVDEAVEVAALILERSLSVGLGLAVHPREEVVAALASYPVPLTPSEFADLEDAWKKQHGPSGDIAGLAKRVLRSLRNHVTAGGLSPRSGER